MHACVCWFSQVGFHLSIHTIRKRKREVLEEDEEISGDELLKQKQQFDNFPANFSLPEDTTGAMDIKQHI